MKPISKIIAIAGKIAFGEFPKAAIPPGMARAAYSKVQITFKTIDEDMYDSQSLPTYRSYNILCKIEHAIGN